MHLFLNIFNIYIYSIYIYIYLYMFLLIVRHVPCEYNDQTYQGIQLPDITGCSDEAFHVNTVAVGCLVYLDSQSGHAFPRKGCDNIFYVNRLNNVDESSVLFFP